VASRLAVAIHVCYWLAIANECNGQRWRDGSGLGS